MESSACLLRLRVSPAIQFTASRPKLSRLTALRLLPPRYPSTRLHLRPGSGLLALTVPHHAPFGPTRRGPLPPPHAAAGHVGDCEGNDYSLGLTNPDLAPTAPSQRTFTAWDMASLWIGLVVGVPSYYLAGSLVGLGMSWLQGVSTVVLANLLLVPILVLTGAAGVHHGVPFPVLARASFGVHGAHVPAMLRALVGCGWFGIETWIGGQAIYHLLVLRGTAPLTAPAVVPWLGTTLPELACFGAFWLAQVAAVWNGVEGLRDFEKLAAPVLVAMTAALLIWAYVAAGGFGRVLSLPSRLTTPAQFQAAFLPALTANVGFWATVALNIPDFTRYAKSQRSQVLGQLGLPLFMGLFTFAGLAITSATEPAFGRLIPDPVHLLSLLCRSSLPLTLLAVSGISLATITTNVAANIVAPANALASLSPSLFTFRRGALVTALLGAACQPWRLLRSSESFVYKWLVGYSALLGPVAGVVLADYYLVKGTKLDVQQLYSGKNNGRYYYFGGFNLAALAALVAGMAPLVPGFVAKVGLVSVASVPTGLLLLYDGAWFVGLIGAGLAYWVLSSLFTGGRGEE